MYTDFLKKKHTNHIYTTIVYILISGFIQSILYTRLLHLKEVNARFKLTQTKHAVNLIRKAKISQIILI